MPPLPKRKRLFWKLLGLGVLTFCLSLWLNYQYGVFTEQLWTKLWRTAPVAVGSSSTASPTPSPGDTLSNSTPSTPSVSVPDLAASPASTVAPSETPSENLLGHLPYPEAPVEELENLTADGGIRLRQNAAQAYLDMVADARQDGVILVALSGFRTQEEQEYLFFGVKAQRGQGATKRAEVSAPPGYSEHHTGYAIDIGDGDAPQANVDESFEQTKAFKWLQDKAPYHSFEMSFPKDNLQGVSYEPWHWRYVGDRDSLETFYKTRSRIQSAENSPSATPDPPNPEPALASPSPSSSSSTAPTALEASTPEE
ncbi:MAG: D-alanyl-D-alanine carboxypeptidase family protein [Oscillatoriales cyanobacterium RM2_1_1]|nr:D-alanyl-D-alanine carboxypeptidase family protein [Oscillatoriales cyanobacterium SM2_3_0]NJO45371.1 D-alanyl-D-alanine carboxypeptidase family protein [Oscillatoriales cyanobacterium RM2_1_1]